MGQEVVDEEAAEADSDVRLPPMPAPQLVTDAPGLDALEAALSSATLVGLDCEWRPRRFYGREGALEEAAPRPMAGVHDAEAREVLAPLALLQLAPRSDGKDSGVFVVDMLALRDQPALASRLLRLLRRYLRRPGVRMLGFSMGEDLARLGRALPGLWDDNADADADADADAPAGGVGQLGATLIDLQPACTQLLGLPRRRLVGLQPACAALLGEAIDKSEQESDWQRRPLSSAQLIYAAKDAYVLPSLFRAINAASAGRLQPRPLPSPPPTWSRSSCRRRC